MLFAGVRGSTKLAEQMSALEFSRLINRFYTVATHILVQTDALVDRSIGEDLEHRQMELKGKSEPIGVRVFRIRRDKVVNSSY